MAKFDPFVRQEPERPTAPTCGRASTGQGDEVGLWLAVEHSRTARYRTTHQGTLKTRFDERAADPMDRDYSKIQSGLRPIFWSNANESPFS